MIRPHRTVNRLYYSTHKTDMARQRHAAVKVLVMDTNDPKLPKPLGFLFMPLAASETRVLRQLVLSGHLPNDGRFDVWGEWDEDSPLGTRRCVRKAGNTRTGENEWILDLIVVETRPLPDLTKG